MVLATAALLSGMAATPAAAQPAVTPAFFATHRERFLAKLPAGSIAVVPTRPPRLRSRPATDPYRQNSDFWYLTGLSGSPESVCVLIPASASAGSVCARFLLFVRPRQLAEREQWTGRRAGVEGARKDFRLWRTRYPTRELWNRAAGARRIRTDASARRRVGRGRGFVRDESPEDLERRNCQRDAPRSGSGSLAHPRLS